VSLGTPDKIRRLNGRSYVTPSSHLPDGCTSCTTRCGATGHPRHTPTRSAGRTGGGRAWTGDVRDIEAAGRERWLGELREEVRTGRYTPQPVRRVMIRGERAWGQRPLGIPTIRDRVCSGRGARPRTDLRSGLRRGAYGIARSGARSMRFARSPAPSTRTHQRRGRRLCSTSTRIPHSALMTSVARRISDGPMLRLIKRC